jgi:hypothetical protein
MLFLTERRRGRKKEILFYDFLKCMKGRSPVKNTGDGAELKYEATEGSGNIIEL